ncbi:MAG: hypothetical protein PUC88_06125 [Clostridia bacterium]|nr:hypothetical protein [Clostridia bacterium]
MNNDENKVLETEENEKVEEKVEETEIISEDIADTAHEVTEDVDDSVDTEADIEEDTLDDAMDDEQLEDADILLEDEGDSNHKVSISKSLIVAASILLVLVLAFSGFMLFANPTPDKALKSSGLCGTWLYRNGDVANYYIFNEDGKLLLKNGTFTSVVNFDIDMEKGNVFNIYSGSDENEELIGTMNFEKYKEDGIDTLKIYSLESEDNALVMQRSELPNNVLKADENFKANESIIGKWRDEENGLEVTFTGEGFITLDFVQTIYEGTYIIEENRVDFTYTTSFTNNITQTESFYYEVKDGKFYFYTSMPDGESEGMEFVKVTE